MKYFNFLQIWMESVILIVFAWWYESNPFWKENGDTNKPNFKILE